MDHISHITEKNYPYNVTVLKATCPWCGKISELKLGTKTWRDGLKAYKNGALVQEAWPTLSPAERELMITGICDECWSTL